jgi:hypothetical protein
MPLVIRLFKHSSKIIHSKRRGDGDGDGDDNGGNMCIGIFDENYILRGGNGRREGKGTAVRRKPFFNIMEETVNCFYDESFDTNLCKKLVRSLARSLLP